MGNISHTTDYSISDISQCISCLETISDIDIILRLHGMGSIQLY